VADWDFVKNLIIGIIEGLITGMLDPMIADLADQLCMPHSPRWYRDRLWFLASGTGQLMRAVPGQAPEVVAEVPALPTVLALTEAGVFPALRALVQARL
jgi:hypothetical protein